MPFFLEAAILSRMRSPVTSRSNWANDARSKVGPLPRRCEAGFKRTASSGAESSSFRLADDAQRRFVGTAECGDLELIRQDSQEQPARQMGGRRSTQMVAPLQPEPLRIEIGEASNHVLDRPCVVGTRRQQRRFRTRAARGSPHRHHAARRALAFASRRIVFESDATSA
jgi:hypothetical protein